jgi:hypothetical protein
VLFACVVQCLHAVTQAFGWFFIGRRHPHPYVSILLSGQMSDEKDFKHLLAEGRKGGILLS